VLYFASAKDAAGTAIEMIPFPDTTPSRTSLSVSELFRILESRHPKLKEKGILSSVAIAVNLEYIELSDGEIKSGDKVAIIPPVSGG